ncbi:flagella synthesis protein FlgN [Stutzerimonas nitrititolerans]|uniref:Flagellar protein FlgN n=1 Tax=Stutzerimonas nitrititolerans TaxID=2482751 RepID=A0AA41WGD5_9GAMM|nr:flagellar protein FlgN [Stutzerimonas nitrititolerans]KRW74957.1 flagellar biosynthesis protein FlgN [Pseudomonas sp. TTU2014-096BSC]WAD28663.1 flagellar protein FlgN [Pseudomonadaceae bacterium T75]SUD83937.1 FlgN family protein [Stutzerimonas stutzeri]HAQ28076.1 flagellar protein FlgN [Pseudomonas sp.]MCO7544837.1 flagellar protein FlgN [Stutzerimonas nitrititolerans]
MQDTALLQQFIDDIGIAEQLLELTNREYQTLSERNLVELEKLLTQKQSLLALLGQHATLRSQALAAHQLSADRSGLEAFCATSPSGTDILEQAGKLEKLLADCRTANERNGQLIRTNQAAVGSMLNILQGSNQAPNLYDRRGGAAKTSHQRPLSQA